MGTSGSGKTTLMNLLGCLDRPTFRPLLAGGRGCVRHCPRIRERHCCGIRKIGFVFQNFNLLPRTSALDNVMMPLSYTAATCRTRRGATGRGLAATWWASMSAWITSRRNFPAGSSSGWPSHGPSSIIPPLLFADEPTGNLDSRTSDEVLRTLPETQRRGGGHDHSGDSRRQRRPLRQTDHPDYRWDGGSRNPPNSERLEGRRAHRAQAGSEGLAKPDRCGVARLEWMRADRPARPATQRHACRADHARHRHRRGCGHRHDGDRRAARPARSSRPSPAWGPTTC